MVVNLKCVRAPREFGCSEIHIFGRKQQSASPPPPPPASPHLTSSPHYTTTRFILLDVTSKRFSSSFSSSPHLTSTPDSITKQVRNAEAAGAVAAIVYDFSGAGPLLPMVGVGC